MIPGFSAKVVPGDVPVLRVHYSADPAKRPGTEDGEAWLGQALSGYAGGRASPRWRREMEIDYGAFGGAKAFPEWGTWKQGPIVCAPFAPTGYQLYGSYDHGWNNPAAFHVHGINGDGQIITLWEFYADRVPLSYIATLIKGKDIVLPRRPEATIEPARLRWSGNPFAEAMRITIADPSMWAEDQPMKDEPNKSTADLFAREGVHFDRGERGGDNTVVEWLLGTLWADPERPRYRITTECPHLIRELGLQKYKDLSEVQALTRDASEVLVDKNNHAWDGLKMFLQRFPPTPSTAKPKAQPATFEWWRKQAIAASKGQPVGTYRRSMVG